MDFHIKADGNLVIERDDSGFAKAEHEFVRLYQIRVKNDKYAKPSVREIMTTLAQWLAMQN